MPRTRRLLRHPFSTLANSAKMRWVNAAFALGRTTTATARTYFGQTMRILLPTGYGEVWLYGATVDTDPEARLNKFLLRELNAGATFFDVGACLGYFSLLGAHLVGEKGRVVTFEPAPNLQPLLRRNLERHARIVPKAVSEASGTTTFHEAPAPWIGTSSLRGDWQKNTREVTVETIALDDFCWNESVFPDVIKIDAEGVEDRVLAGAKRLLREKGPVIAVEVIMPLIGADRRALAILRACGYEPFAIEDDGSPRALTYEGIDAYLEQLKEKYRRVHDSGNDFDNLVFKKS